MKKILALVLAAALLMALIPTAVADGGGKTMWVYTKNGKVLFVRSSMSTKDNSNIVGSLPYRSKVTVYGHNAEGWALIEYPDYGDHYVMYRFLLDHDPGPYEGGGSSGGGSSSGSSDTFSTKDASTVAQMNTLVASAKVVAPYSVTVRPNRASGWVYMRWFPSKSAAQVATFSANHELTVIAELKDWFQVEDPSTGRIGFVYKSYIQ